MAVHISEPWVEMYIKRWLETPIQLEDGTLLFSKGKGTPQCGVLSPLLSNLFLHYAIDKLLAKEYSEIKMVRYADDMIIHCRKELEATLDFDSLNY